MNLPLTPLRFRERTQELYGNNLGVVCGDHRFTYTEFFNRCDRLAAAIKKMGVLPGERVAFLAYNCHCLMEAYYGVPQSGAVLLPLNIRFSRDDLAYALNDSESKALFYDPDFQPLIASIKSELRTVKQCIPLSSSSAAPGSPSYEQLLAESLPEPAGEISLDEDSVAELFYTSGTSARPKGVMLSHRNLYLHALNSVVMAGMSDQEIILHTIPLFHVNGWGAPQSVTAVGGTHIMLRKFDPSSVLDLIEKEKVTLMLLVPTMAGALLQCPDLGKHDYSSLRMVLLGGAASSPALIERLQTALGCPAYAGYGLTETSPILTLTLPRRMPPGATEMPQSKRRAMTGWPMIGVSLRVVDENGAQVKNDGVQMGEIIVRSDGLMKGYWGQPEETNAVLRDGWFYTGDMATVDSENCIQIVDRKKEIIVSGGENISSIEIERCLSLHPAIAECAVLPVPDPKWGEVPKALVVLQNGNKPTEEEIIAFCRERLAPFKCPRSVDFLEQLPKGGTGKILKKVLRERYWSNENKRVGG